VPPAVISEMALGGRFCTYQAYPSPRVFNTQLAAVG
jgi:hypothetical protein